MATNKGYTTVSDPDTTAKALSKEQPISPKFAREVACAVKGMTVPQAQAFLESVKLPDDVLIVVCQRAHKYR